MGVSLYAPETRVRGLRRLDENSSLLSIEHAFFSPVVARYVHLPGASCQSVVLYSISMDVRNLSLLVIVLVTGRAVLGLPSPRRPRSWLSSVLVGDHIISPPPLKRAEG